MGICHVIPTNDAMEHREGTDCPCNPRVEQLGLGDAVIVHHAWDGREIDEQFVSEMIALEKAEH